MVEKLYFIVVGMIIMVIVMGIWNIYKYHVRNLEIELDQLTGLDSVHKFHVEASKKLQNCSDIPCALIVFDIDNFKYINEVFGYKQGTRVIEIIGKMLQEQKLDNMFIGKLSADQFIMLTWDMDYSRLFKLYEINYHRLLQILRKELDKEYKVTFSVGVYFVKDHNLDLNHMIDCAFLALREGKNKAENTVYYYTSEMKLTRQHNNEVIANMQDGIDKKEFIVYYQSQINLATEEIVGVEALVRWKRDNMILSPNDFIPIFEKSGFIKKLDIYVLEEVCKYVSANFKTTPLHVSVNISGVTLLQDEIVLQILTVVEKYNLNPKYIELELTESAFAEISQKSIHKLEQLRSYGFKISMDDFGTGVSSLHRLKNLPFDYLKIDKAFINDVVESYKCRIIIASIIEMAKKLNLKVVAKGVEKEEHVGFLRELHCDIVQGYYYAKPVPAEELIIK